jgi:hypothetical protein
LALALFAPSGTGAATPIIVPNPGFAAGAAFSFGVLPNSVFLNADGTPGAAGDAGAAAGFGAPNADAAPVCDAGFASVVAGFENAEPAAPINVALGEAGLGGAADSGESASITPPSLAMTKLVLHFGQRIFIPDAGMRRSSTSYGDLHETHSTLIMDDRTALLTPHVLRGVFRRDAISNGCTLHGLRISRDIGA